MAADSPDQKARAVDERGVLGDCLGALRGGLH